jgi:hypothetical protein
VDRLEAHAKYYHYGVVSIELDEQFSVDWPELVEAAASRLSDPSLEHRAMELLKKRLTKAPAALLNPYRNWLSEDYTIIAVLPEPGITAPDLIAKYGRQIAQIVRGETRALSEGEYQATLSYYPNDLLVVGLSAAFVYDNPTAAEPTVQLLEYANTQLLEFRRYDDLLTTLLAGVYRTLERGTGVWRRWVSPRKPNALTPSGWMSRYRRTHRNIHQIPQRHVLRPHVPSGRGARRRARLSPFGRSQTANRRRTL